MKLGLVSSGDDTYALFRFSKELAGYRESYFRDTTDPLDYYKVSLYFMSKYGYEYDVYFEYPGSEELVRDFCEKSISDMCSEIEPKKILEDARDVLIGRASKLDRKVQIWLYNVLFR